MNTPRKWDGMKSGVIGSFLSTVLTANSLTSSVLIFASFVRNCKEKKERTKDLKAAAWRKMVKDSNNKRREEAGPGGSRECQ